MWPMKWKTTIVASVGLLFLIVVGYCVWLDLIRESYAKASAAGDYTSAYISAVTLIVLIITVVVAGRQLKLGAIQLQEIRRDRDTEIFTAILHRYAEDERLFGIRTFVNRHRAEINEIVTNKQNPPATKQRILDAKMRSLSHQTVTLQDVMRLIIIINHACLLIERRFVSREVGLIFHPLILNMWDVLHELVYLERQRRRKPLKDVRRERDVERFAADFEALSMKLYTGEYQFSETSRLKNKRIDLRHYWEDVPEELRRTLFSEPGID